MSLSKNKFPHFGYKPKPYFQNTKSKLANLKDGCSSFGRVGNVNLLISLNMKIRNTHRPCLTADLSVWCIKSQLMSILENGLDNPVTEPPIDILINSR